MKRLKKLWPFLFIAIGVLIFFNPIFRGEIPFPGDLLISQNPYISESFLGYTPGSYPNKAQGPDVIYEIYPWKYFSIEQIKSGQIPFWNPYNFSGNPQMANFQTAIFYPLNFIYLILPFNLAWTIFIMMQPVLASIFMFLFLHKGLRLKKFPAVLGGISFAFCSYMVVWIEYGNISQTFLWLPLALLLIKRLVEKNKLSTFIFLVIVFTLSLLAGYIQGLFYIYVVSVLYFLFLLYSQKTKQKLKKSLSFISSLIFPIILCAFQLLPMLELFTNSSRGAYSLEQISQKLAPFHYLITIIFPDFFGNPASRNYWLNGTYIERVMYPGAVMFFFAIMAIFKAKFSEKRFFTCLGVLSLIFATNLPLMKYFYLLPIPILSTTVPTRGLSIFIFSAIVLGAIGINYWIENEKNKTKYPLVFGLLLIIIFHLVFLTYQSGFLTEEHFRVSIRNMLLPTFLAFSAIIIFYLKNKFKEISMVLIALLIILDLLYFFNKITPFSPSSFTYPETPIVKYLQENAGINRFWGYGSGYIAANLQAVDKTYSPEGNDPLHISRYGELLAASSDGEIPKEIPRPDANIAPGYGEMDLKLNQYRQRLLNLLGVKYVLHRENTLSENPNPDYRTFPEDKYKLIWQKTPWQIYENKVVFPRFYLVDKYEVVLGKDNIISKIYAEKTDLRKTVVLEKSPDIKLGAISKSKIKLVNYEPNKINFKIETDANSLFFISDNFYPGWKALVDGKNVEIYRANYSFRAVLVEKGEHYLQMYYYPDSFKLGLKISVFGFLLVLFYLLFFRKFYEK